VSQDIQVPAGDKLIFKKSIEMYFGSPTSDELLEKLNKRAIEWNLSVEAILLGEFEHIYNSMQKKRVLKYEDKDYNLNGFDSHCVVHANIEGVFFSPPAQFGKYSHNGFTYPKLIFHDGYLRNKENVQEFLLTDETIKKLGQEYEQIFAFEFIGFERISLNDK
jgi:hypothetical protein